MPRKRNADNTQSYVAGLARQLRSRDKGKRAAARAALCAAFEPLVKALAARYQQGVIGAELPDMEQQARLGVLESCATFNHKKFDPKKGSLAGLFAAHTEWRVRGALSSYVQRLENPTRLPTALLHKLPRLRRLQGQLGHTLMREPTLEEMSHALNVSETAVAAMMSYDDGPLRLDQTGYASGHLRNLDKALWRALRRSLAAPVLTPEQTMIAREEAESVTREARAARAEQRKKGSA
jgi:DNA-directed RNA polymerase sigma subunit (sigma70/sigma32)